MSIPAARHRRGSWRERVQGARGARGGGELAGGREGHTSSLPRPFQGSPFDHPLVHLIQHQYIAEKKRRRGGLSECTFASSAWRLSMNTRPSECGELEEGGSTVALDVDPRLLV
jgi:hypothetical protein